MGDSCATQQLLSLGIPAPGESGFSRGRAFKSFGSGSGCGKDVWGLGREMSSSF